MSIYKAFIVLFLPVLLMTATGCSISKNTNTRKPASAITEAATGDLPQQGTSDRVNIPAATSQKSNTPDTLAASAAPSIQETEGTQVSGSKQTKNQSSIYSKLMSQEEVNKMDKVDIVIGIERLEETIQQPRGNGDNWHMTWAKNDKQYVGLCDGTGFPELPQCSSQEYNSKIYAMNGEAPDFSFEYMPGYPELKAIRGNENREFGRYYGLGILALDNYIYHFLSTARTPFGPAGNSFIGAKLIYSPDNGESWKNQDGTPAVWEAWDDRNSDNMVFWNEPGEAFTLLSILQMGKNYEYNKDGYVYIYAPNGNVDGSMNQLVMFRVKKDKILHREAYEYFVSRNSDGSAKWSKDINDRGVVHTFPAGWINWDTINPAYSWQPSVVYNEPLGVYMMANWGTGASQSGDWFGTPSYLGFWVAPNPWGPWKQIHEDTAWTPNGDEGTRAYQPQISPKWISDDGKSFWLVWSDFRFVEDSKYYSFNYQKVNILTR